MSIACRHLVNQVPYTGVRKYGRSWMIPDDSKNGKRIVTFVQSPCRCFNMRCGDNDNDCCGDCNYYADKKEMPAACECEEVMKEQGGRQYDNQIIFR